MILNDKQIKDLCNSKEPMISPYCNGKEINHGISYGQSSYGYDIRLGHVFNEIGQVKNRWGESCTIVEPENPGRVMWTKHTVDGVPYIIAPNDFVLAVSLERFIMPRSITGVVKDKSTYARLGIAVQNTVIEAGWRGYLTLEITNHSKYKVALHPNTGIAQMLFFKGENCENPYPDQGKYQDQSNEPTTPQASTKDQLKEQGSIRREGSMPDNVKDNRNGSKKKLGKR